MQPLSRTIRRPTSVDLAAIKSLWSKRFHGDETTPNDVPALIESAQQPAQTGTIGYVAIVDDTLAGFTFALTMNAEDAQQTLSPYTPENSLPNVNAVITTIATDPNHEHQGIASALLDKTIDTARTIGVQQLLAISWRRPNHIDSSPLFEKHQFGNNGTIPNYYARSNPPREACPDCEGTCTCDGTVYRLTL